MIRYCQWICLLVAVSVFDVHAIAQESRSEIKYHVVANTLPPDAFVALRTHPSSEIGKRIELMPNGTALEVLKTNPDGWWYVRVVASRNEGWALSGQKQKRWIVCCINGPSIAATNSVIPKLNEAPAIDETPSRSAGPPSPMSQVTAPVNKPVRAPANQNATSDETILQRCVRETGASPGIMNALGGPELLKCIDNAQTEQASQLGDRACNVNACIFKLKYVSEGTYSGYGYTLKHRVASRASKFGSQTLTTYDSVLTTDDGKQAVLGQTVGPVGSIFGLGPPSSASGDISASYTGPFGTDTNAYVALVVPREFITTDQEPKTAVLPPDCQNPSTINLVPCGLMGKVVAYRYEESSTNTFQDGKVSKSSTRQSGKILFGKNDDVYLFLPTVDGVRQIGFAYKLNLEIDFIANRLRAPKDFTAVWPMEPTVYKGRMEFNSDTLVIRDVFAFNAGTTQSELKIKFSRGFDTCSVADFSNNSGASGFVRQSTSRLAKPVACRVYSAR